MKQHYHSKSGLFLMELLINLLLFCLLCGCGLMFFLKSRHLSEDATTLHQAVSITSSIAGIYESGDEGLTSVLQCYPTAAQENQTLTLYLNEDLTPCTAEKAVYSVIAKQTISTVCKLQIDFCTTDGRTWYSITACRYTPATPGTAKEVSTP